MRSSSSLSNPVDMVVSRSGRSPFTLLKKGYI